MNTKKIEFKVSHNKPFFPANKNAENYIESTFNSVLSKLPEFDDLILGKVKKHDLHVVVKASFSVEEMGRLNVIVNRINKTGRNASKKFGTKFSPVSIQLN